MRIYVDESVNTAIVEGLKRRGVDAFSAKDMGKLGLTDEQQIKVAAANRAAICTLQQLASAGGRRFSSNGKRKAPPRHNLRPPAEANCWRVHKAIESDS